MPNETAHHDRVDDPARHHEGEHRVRVLIVDDDPAVLSTLQDLLQTSDFDVVGSTNDGEHALDLARVLHPDLALIDWDMRHFGGALTARLMRRYAPSVTPVLLVEEADIPEVDRAGFEFAFSSVLKETTAKELGTKLRNVHRYAVTPRSHRASNGTFSSQPD
jgi:DNA-binding NarL/FixJ family response regulator